ncbi:hypothetical protein MASR1M90_23600 [Desulfovibrionales bacterium]
MTLSEKLIQSWPAPLVARAEVGRFSGGLLHPRTMANLDALGEGPGKIVVGRRVAYDRDQLATWIESRATGQGVQA